MSPGATSEGVGDNLGGSRTGAFAADREPVVGVEGSDDDHAEGGKRGAEESTEREPGERELEAPADRRRARRVEGFAEQPVAPGVLPDADFGSVGAEPAWAKPIDVYAIALEPPPPTIRRSRCSNRTHVYAGSS